MSKENENFVEGIISLFFSDVTTSILREEIPLFEFKKIDIRKLQFELASLINSYSAIL